MTDRPLFVSTLLWLLGPNRSARPGPSQSKTGKRKGNAGFVTHRYTQTLARVAPWLSLVLWRRGLAVVRLDVPHQIYM
jgi:hypothetical protein